MLTAEERETIEIAVANSAEVMDELLPDWFTLIERKTFDVDDADNCIAGQVWPHRAFHHVYMHMLRPSFMGRFDGPDAFKTVHARTAPGVTPLDSEVAYTNECWQSEIADRLEMDDVLTEMGLDLVLAAV